MTPYGPESLPTLKLLHIKNVNLVKTV